MMEYPPCGRLCSAETCEGKRLGLCPGCVEAKGSPSGCTEAQVPEEYKGLKICPIWKCAEEHDVEYCGQCREFPCKTFLS